MGHPSFPHYTVRFLTEGTKYQGISVDPFDFIRGAARELDKELIFSGRTFDVDPLFQAEVKRDMAPGYNPKIDTLELSVLLTHPEYRGREAQEIRETLEQLNEGIGFNPNYNSLADLGDIGSKVNVVIEYSNLLGSDPQDFVSLTLKQTQPGVFAISSLEDLHSTHYGVFNTLDREGNDYRPIVLGMLHELNNLGPVGLRYDNSFGEDDKILYAPKSISSREIEEDIPQDPFSFFRYAADQLGIDLVPSHRYTFLETGTKKARKEEIFSERFDFESENWQHTLFVDLLKPFERDKGWRERYESYVGGKTYSNTVPLDEFTFLEHTFDDLRFFKESIDIQFSYRRASHDEDIAYSRKLDYPSTTAHDPLHPQSIRITFSQYLNDFARVSTTAPPKEFSKFFKGMYSKKVDYRNMVFRMMELIAEVPPESFAPLDTFIHYSLTLEDKLADSALQALFTRQEVEAIQNQLADARLNSTKYPSIPRLNLGMSQLPELNTDVHLDQGILFLTEQMIRFNIGKRQDVIETMAQKLTNHIVNGTGFQLKRETAESVLSSLGGYLDA